MLPQPGLTPYVTSAVSDIYQILSFLFALARASLLKVFAAWTRREVAAVTPPAFPFLTLRRGLLLCGPFVHTQVRILIPTLSRSDAHIEAPLGASEKGTPA